MYQWDYRTFLHGDVNGTGEPSFVSWEGKEMIPYENMTRQLFNTMDEDLNAYGSLVINGSIDIGKALNIFMFM